jgi:hypothetical protein
VPMPASQTVGGLQSQQPPQQFTQPSPRGNSLEALGLIIVNEDSHSQELTRTGPTNMTVVQTTNRGGDDYHPIILSSSDPASTGFGSPPQGSTTA